MQRDVKPRDGMFGSNRFWVAATVGFVGFLGAFTNAVAQDQGDDELVILDRQLIMQQLDKDAKAIGMILAGIQSPDELRERAESLAQGAREARDAFEISVPGGSAKPEIWTNWNDFSARMDRFVEKSAEMAKAAEAGNIAVINEMVVEAMPCKQCHDHYRAKKNDS